MTYQTGSLFSLEGKVALVTGGAQGLGRMIAAGMIAAGARVFITSRTAELCEEAEKALGENCRAITGNAGKPEGISAIIETLQKEGVKSLNILVNNAGRTWGAPLESFPDKGWPGVMETNVQAPFRLIQECLHLLSAGGTKLDPARIINIGSIAGAVVNDLNAYSYVASKAALHQLSHQLAADLADRNINVNTILPGFFPTSMTAHMRNEEERRLEKAIPLGRLGMDSDIVGAIIFLASQAGSYITGIELPVDGGVTGASLSHFTG